MAVSSTHVVARAIGSFAIAVAVVIGFLATASASAADEPNRTEIKNPRLKDLLNERLATTKEFAKQVKMRFDNQTGTIDQLVEANRLVTDAELDLCESDKERIAVLEKLVAETKETEKRAAQLASTRQATIMTGLKARMERLRAEIALERARAKADAKQK